MAYYEKTVISILSTAILLTSVSSVAFAEQNTVSPQGVITPQAVGADSGWATQNNIRARVYTDATSYGPSSDYIKVTAEKSTDGPVWYYLSLEKKVGNSWTQVGQVDGTLYTGSVNHEFSINSAVPSYSEATLRARLKFYKYGDGQTWLGDWVTNTFIAVN
ncbi:hypothetical protein P4H65_24025 [Paenibacillus chitinolyticus]|uniref:hypothetical protein n=1 Tax=Paenibacillus chitinolyticus TaxID=79263 RepID=UPI002DB6671E|nr:hypothetical protein [Paenibacillus chitinolyticus]MEC0248865.1 hypothetical protein [Paenibacillus chitinolyticus]